MTEMKLQVAVLALFGTISWTYAAIDPLYKRQIGATIVDNAEDHSAAESGFVGAATHHGGKYFQYIHVPSKDHYEFGHKRGNDHHFIERHERAHPHAGEFKTKVRWGDKHGGYGEHYWDFNHAGHGDGSGEETQNEPEYAEYEDAPQRPKYQHAPIQQYPLYQYEETQQVPKYVNARSKRQPDNPNDDVEFINENVRSLVLSGLTGKHGGNYRRDPSFDRDKRQYRDDDEKKASNYQDNPGIIVDEKTGRKYKLKPIEY